MWCESGGRPDAIGGGSNYGLFQLNAIWAKRWPEFWQRWSDAAWNIAHAFELWTSSGWGPWGCAPWRVQ